MELLLAAGLSESSVILLILTAGFTSFFTASMGIGGGTLLMAVMASIVPISALIPIHGLVQLGSNANRLLMTHQHLDWRMAGYFALGSVPGALLASAIVVQLPLVLIQLTVAGFILFMVWGKPPNIGTSSRRGQSAAGAITTLITMFVGATGPLVAGILFRKGYDKLTQTATLAACLSVQHVLKGLVFSFIGFSFLQWLPLVATMIAAGALGTWIGLKLLNRLPTQVFRALFKVSISLLAIRLIWDALAALLETH